MRVALTGAATGIGASVASKLKAGGHHVTAFDISEPTANVDVFIQTDLGDPASVRAAIDSAQGPFDALINNAGLPPRDGQAELTLRVNFLGFRGFLDGMIDRISPGGAIVNTASRAGAMWRDNLDEVKALMALDPALLSDFVRDHDIGATRAYNLSKEAVIVLTMASTETLIAKGLRMNTVSPAAVSTGILDDFITAFGERVAKNVARAGRPGHPDEVADVMMFLISPQSAWIKGQDIVVDGGMSAFGASDMLGLSVP